MWLGISATFLPHFGDVKMCSKVDSMHNSRILSTLIGFLYTPGGVGRPKVATNSGFTDEWVPGHFGYFATPTSVFIKDGLLGFFLLQEH
jgi:hypothetical protein